MSIYLDEKNPGKHTPFTDASPDIVEYVRYLEVIAGKSANTAFSYYCGGELCRFIWTKRTPVNINPLQTPRRRWWSRYGLWK